jgi:hypothetical protein
MTRWARGSSDSAARSRFSYSSKSKKPADGFGIGSRRIVQDIRSSTFHSTAFRSTTLSTVNTLLTVFGARLVSACFKRCTCSVVIASSRFAPKCGCKCTRPMVSFAAMALLVRSV